MESLSDDVAMDEGPAAPDEVEPAASSEPMSVTVRISIPSSESFVYRCPTPASSTLRSCALAGMEHADKKTWTKRLEKYGHDVPMPLFLVKQVPEGDLVDSHRDALSNGFELLATIVNSAKQETDDAQSTVTSQRSRRSGGSSAGSPNNERANGELQQAAVTVLQHLMERVPTNMQSNSSLAGAAGSGSIQLQSPESIGIALLQAMLGEVDSSLGASGQGTRARSGSAQAAVAITVNNSLSGIAGRDVSGLRRVRECLEQILDAIRHPSQHSSLSDQSPPSSFAALGAQISETIARLSATAGSIVASSLSRTIETRARASGFTELGQEIRQSRLDSDLQCFRDEVHEELRGQHDILSALQQSISELINRLPARTATPPPVDGHVRPAPPGSSASPPAPSTSASNTGSGGPGSHVPLARNINTSHTGSAGSRSITRSGTDTDLSGALPFIFSNRSLAQEGPSNEHNFSATGAAGAGAYTQHS